jgi:hypothetical protein
VATHLLLIRSRKCLMVIRLLLDGSILFLTVVCLIESGIIRRLRQTFMVLNGVGAHTLRYHRWWRLVI